MERKAFFAVSKGPPFAHWDCFGRRASLAMTAHTAKKLAVTARPAALSGTRHNWLFMILVKQKTGDEIDSSPV